VTRAAARSARRLVDHQRRAAERLRREVMGADGSLRHPYFRALRRQLASFERLSTRGDLLAAAARADIVYVGDFHAVPEYRAFAAELLEQLARRVPRLALGIEFIHARQQYLLDRRQAGELDDETLLRRLHFTVEWGYPWASFAALLDRARAVGVPVHALDVAPRAGFAGLRRRDVHAARRLVSIVRRDPATRLLVLFGEAHLARGHLPRRVKSLLKRAGIERREIVVFQNPDRLYWQWLETDSPRAQVVRVDRGSYAVFHTNPLAKYEAYRQVLERWRSDSPPDEEVDLTPAVHHLIRVLLGWIGIRPDRRRVHHRAGWSEDLVDAFPEVYGGAEATELLGPILAERGRTAEEIDEATRRLRERGALYESRSNTVFLQRYEPGPAAGECARFVRTALTGRLFDGGDEFAAHPAARAYGAAFNEALCRLGAAWIDPACDDPPRPVRAAGAGTAGALAVTGQERWLVMHRRFEASRRTDLPRALAEQLRRSRETRRALAADLGARLGRVLCQRVRSGRLRTPAVAKLFQRPLRPRSARAVVLGLLREG